jgi:hypothetical protein
MTLSRVKQHPSLFCSGFWSDEVVMAKTQLDIGGTIPPSGLKKYSEFMVSSLKATRAAVLFVRCSKDEIVKSLGSEWNWSSTDWTLRRTLCNERWEIHILTAVNAVF